MAIGGGGHQVRVPAGERSGRWRDRQVDPAWLLLPQRLFLGVTFAYAGLDKLADRSFFDPAAPTSIQAQITAVRDTSPLGPLLRATSQHATTLGVLIALGEIAVGLATLLGVRARVAAAGGAVISLSLLLTVTWATRPYYYGSDIVFLVCWLPLIAFGDGGLFSLDAAVARRVAARPEIRPDRRALLALGIPIAVTAGIAGVAALVARGLRGSSAPPAASQRPGAAAPKPGAAGGTEATGRLAAAADVPVGGALAVTLPGTGAPALLLQPSPRKFVAFSAVCTHAGCTVAAAPDGRTFRCPCHGAVYDAATGGVLSGPAPAPLPSVPVHVVGPDVVTDG